MLLETGAATHIGKVRRRNEDCYLTLPESGLWAVADGMGGHADGDAASYTVIEALRYIQNPSSPSELISLCEASIFEANSKLKEMSRRRGAIIGTTVTVLLVCEGYFASLWCGDSRLYIVRDGEISQISRDHTEVQELLAKGTITREEAERWRGGSAITRAIGIAERPELEMTTGELHAGDVFVICTDGLTQHVHDTEILRCVSSCGAQPACDRLIALTFERGAIDNVTVIVVRYRPAAHANPTPPWEWPK